MITPVPLEMRLLNALFDAGGEMQIEDIRSAIPARGVDIRRAIDRQSYLGNVRRRVMGEPITMTASARAAVAAGRAHLSWEAPARVA